VRFLEIKNNIEEQLPLLVASALGLHGVQGVQPKDIDELVKFSRPRNFTFDQILDVGSYRNAFLFIGQCANSDYAVLNGDIVMAIVNFLMRNISLKGSFVREGVDLLSIRTKLTNLLNVKTTPSTVFDTVSDILDELAEDEYQFLAYDNYVLRYMISTFYLLSSAKGVCVFTDTTQNVEDLFEEFMAYLDELGAGGS
jgi:uncharacterized protein YuzB (UPF0349 family)